MRRNRRWFDFHDADCLRWRVVLASAETVPPLEHAWGITDYEHRTIYVNARAPDQAETLLHELMHVALQHEDMTREEEHRIIETLSPKLWPLLEACGVQWPVRPKR